MRLKSCAIHGLYSDDNKRCPKCTKEFNKFYDNNSRDKDIDKFYNSTLWRKTRDKIARRDGGLCQECLRHGNITKFDVVDHIMEIKDGGCKLCEDNLECLCHSCHNRKTKQKANERT